MQSTEELISGADVALQGMVIKKSQGAYWVKNGGRAIICSISSKLRKELVYPTADPSSRRHRVVETTDIHAIDPVAIGDLVRFEDAHDGAGVIKEVLPRKNRLSRRASGPQPLEQIIAANVDQIVVVFAAAQPKLKWNLVDRYLASAEASAIPPLLCITKMDLVDGADLAADLSVYRQIGYAIHLVSAQTGVGIEEIKNALWNKFSVFVGISGAGKTTLLNAIQPELGLRTKQVSDSTGKGKHTTSHLEIHDLDFGGAVADTPGMREFGLWNVKPEQTANLFPEMRPFLGQCRFGADCSHKHEPGCAIKAAVERGEIARRRYQSCMNL